MTDPWSALLERARRERALAAEGRWEELAASTAERVRLAAVLGPAPRQARQVLEALAVVQTELTRTLESARARTARELSGAARGRGAMAGYAAMHAASRRPWVDDAA